MQFVKMFSPILLFLLLFPLIFAGDYNSKEKGGFDKSIECFIGTVVNGSVVGNFTMNCTDSVDFERRKCIKVECDFDEPHGRIVHRSCGNCRPYFDDWAEKPKYSKACECEECTKDLCNSAKSTIGQGIPPEYSLIRLMVTIVPLLLLTILLI